MAGSWASESRLANRDLALPGLVHVKPFTSKKKTKVV
jgi:hypothetical protein